MPGPRPRILLGEEEPLVRTFILEALRHSGFLVEAGRDEAELLLRMHGEDFSLLILDYELARRSAFAGITSLRERTPAVPIILMAAGPVETIAYTYRVHLLRKPFGAKGLRDAVDRAMPGGC
jgi:DNA-binding response OmpR family regulator